MAEQRERYERSLDITSLQNIPDSQNGIIELGNELNILRLVIKVTNGSKNSIKEMKQEVVNAEKKSNSNGRINWRNEKDD